MTAVVPTISFLVSSEVFSYSHVDDINLLGENTSVIKHMGATNVQLGPYTNGKAHKGYVNFYSSKCRETHNSVAILQYIDN